MCTSPSDSLVDGCYTYRIRLSDGAAMFGFAPESLPLMEHEACHSSGYYLHSNGTLWSQAGDRGHDFLGRKIAMNEEITIIYDPQAHTISFRVGYHVCI